MENENVFLCFFELPPDLSGGQYEIQLLALAKIFILFELIFFYIFKIVKVYRI